MTIVNTIGLTFVLPFVILRPERNPTSKAKLMPTYQQYRSYGHTRFTAWSLSHTWTMLVGLPLAANVVGWGAAYFLGYL